jgi:N-acetylglucosaminyl-diphospho-decaprenol L-rhamnosyltransferase
VAVEVSYCVVNTNGRELLLSCLEAINRTHPDGVDHEILVLDNASNDGSADAVTARFPHARLIARERRAGLAENNTLLLREARGRFCLLLNEDSEILEGAARALLDTLEADERAAVAGAQLVDPDGAAIACAWRFPGPGTALAQALFLHRWLVTQSGSGGGRPREVGWVQSCTMLVRREAAERVGYLDPDFFVYSEEVDFQKRLHDAGWRILHVPAARAIHREQLATDRSAWARRIVQFQRGRETYMRKHHSAAVAALCRVLWAWSYVPRAVAAMILPGHDARRYWLHARQALRPTHGEGMREAADAYNLKLAASRDERAPSGQVPGRSSSRATAS